MLFTVTITFRFDANPGAGVQLIEVSLVQVVFGQSESPIRIEVAALPESPKFAPEIFMMQDSECSRFFGENSRILGLS